MIKKFAEILNEKMGITSDGEILSDFLIEYLSDAKADKTYIFVRPEHEQEAKRIGMGTQLRNPSIKKELENNIYKVYASYVDEDLPMEAFFDPLSSKYTKNGYILYFTFVKKPSRDKIWYHHVYHEIHHGMQFIAVKKKKFTLNKKNIRLGILKKSEGLSILLNEFLDLYYHSIDTEQDAMIAQFYGKLKHRKNIKNIDDLKAYFKNRNIYEYGVAYKMANCDLFKLFALKYKDSKTGEIFPIETLENLAVFFSAIKHMGSKMKDIQDIDEFFKFMNDNKMEMDKIEVMNVEELTATMKAYTRYFNKIGEKLVRKLDRTYALLADYYTEKFKNEKDEKPKKKRQLPKSQKEIVDSDIEDRHVDEIDWIND
jgi:NACalpha-BTF3-like transcription factor